MESSHALPERDRRSTMMPIAASTITPRMANHQVLTKFEPLRSMRVGSGNCALKDLKKVTNFGMTNAANTTTTTTAITATTAG